MSVGAMHWAFTHSPYTGAKFAVHLAVADSVNDEHGSEFWMTQSKLARKARVARTTACAALADMEADGFLTRLESRDRGQVVRWRFETPDTADPVYDPKKKGGNPQPVPRDDRSDPQPVPRDDRYLSPETTGVSPETTGIQSQEEPKEEPKKGSAAQGGTPPALPLPDLSPRGDLFAARDDEDAWKPIARAPCKLPSPDKLPDTAGGTRTYPTEFEVVWDEWPRRKGRRAGKPEAYKQWVKRRARLPVPVLLGAVRRYAKACEAANEFPCDMSRFFGDAGDWETWLGDAGKAELARVMAGAQPGDGLAVDPVTGRRFTPVGS